MSKAKKIWFVGNYLLGCATLGAAAGYGVAAIANAIQEHIRRKKVKKAIQSFNTFVEQLKELEKTRETDTENSEET